MSNHNNHHNDFDNENDNDEYIGFNSVDEDTAIKLICPIMSDGGNTLNCFASGCMAWQWTNSVNNNMGICLML